MLAFKINCCLFFKIKYNFIRSFDNKIISYNLKPTFRKAKKRKMFKV